MKASPWEPMLAVAVRRVRALCPSSPLTDAELWAYGRWVMRDYRTVNYRRHLVDEIIEVLNRPLPGVA